MTENPENPDKNPYFTWRQFFKILSGFGTQEELRQYIHARSFDREDDEHALCERYRDKLLRTSPLIIFLQENCRKLGAELNSSNIVCRRCDTLSKFPISSKFSEAGGIVLCQNHVPTYGEMEDKLAHEMVHAYDHLRFNYDYRNIRHRACAEVGEPRLLSLRRHTPEGVRRSRQLTILALPNRYEPLC